MNIFDHINKQAALIALVIVLALAGAFFYYLGSYSSADNRWRGEIVNQEHTAARDAIFGGYEVGIGFSGSCGANGAIWEATALAGKRSFQLAAEMKLLHRI